MSKKTAKSNSKVRDSKTRTKDTPKGDAALRERCAEICRQFRDFDQRNSKAYGPECSDEEKKKILELGLQVAKQVIELDALLTAPGSFDMLCEVGNLSGADVYEIQKLKWLIRCRPLAERNGSVEEWTSTNEAFDSAISDFCNGCDGHELEEIKLEELAGQVWNPDISDVPEGLSLGDLYWYVLNCAWWDVWQTPRFLDEMVRRKKLTVEHCREWNEGSEFACTGGLFETQEFLENRGLAVDSTLAWLKSKGIHCDLDVVTRLCLGVTCFQPERHMHCCEAERGE